MFFCTENTYSMDSVKLQQLSQKSKPYNLKFYTNPKSNTCKPAELLKDGKKFLNKTGQINLGIEKVLQATEPVNNFVYLPALKKALNCLYHEKITKNQRSTIISKILEAGNNGQYDLLEQLTYKAIEEDDFETTEKICIDNYDIIAGIVSLEFSGKKNKKLSPHEMFRLAECIVSATPKYLYIKTILQLLDEAQKSDPVAQFTCAEHYALGSGLYKRSVRKSLDLYLKAISGCDKMLPSYELLEILIIISEMKELTDIELIEKKIELLKKLYEALPCVNKHSYDNDDLREKYQVYIITTMYDFMLLAREQELTFSEKHLLKKVEFLEKLLHETTRQNAGDYKEEFINILCKFWENFYFSSVNDKKPSYLYEMQVQKLKELFRVGKDLNFSVKEIGNRILNVYVNRQSVSGKHGSSYKYEKELEAQKKLYGVNCIEFLPLKQYDHIKKAKQ